MIAVDLARQLNETGWPDTPVMAMDDSGRAYTIQAVGNEAQTDDGEGHVTSTGATVWLTLEEL